MEVVSHKLLDSQDFGCLLVAGVSVSAGFPSPAEDFLEPPLNLFSHLVRHPAATFAIRVRGDSMKGAGVFNDDLLIVDRAVDATDGAIVVAVVEGQMTVKRLRKTKDGVFLYPENPSFQPIPVLDEDAAIWGVVIYSIHRPK